MVPMLAGVLGMPLKRALGTSLLAIVALVVPGTIVHAALHHIDWTVFLVLTIGAVPGARIGARLALGTKERTLRLLVGRSSWWWPSRTGSARPWPLSVAESATATMGPPA